MFRFFKNISINIQYKIARISNIHTTNNNLAGHSKWANIKHIKALKDGKKSIMFTKLARQIRIAIQDGGSPNPSLNSSLRNTIDEALKKNMPNATIKNILKKYSDNSSQQQLKKYILEMKLINKIFIVCILYTDNYVGVKMNISTLLRKSGGSFSDTRHLFNDKGIIDAKLIDGHLINTNSFEDICIEHAINCGAEEYEITDQTGQKAIFICEPDYLDTVRNNLTNVKWFVESSEHIFMPNNVISLSETELATFNLFKEKIKSVDGLEEIYDNLKDE